MIALTIPDIHLKPEIFDQADTIMASEPTIDKAVCLMDIADDWGKQFDATLYEQTFARAIKFAQDHPDTLWCWGNHDLSYLWKKHESGYSSFVEDLVFKMLRKFTHVAADTLDYMHLVDNTLFVHGGLSNGYVSYYCPDEYDDPKAVVDKINNYFTLKELWLEDSPIWLRPQLYHLPMYKEESLLQVVGHTPVQRVYKCGSVLSCDSFSTSSTGRHIGEQCFVIVDTVTHEWQKTSALASVEYALEGEEA